MIRPTHSNPPTRDRGASRALRWPRRALARLDALFDRLYGWRYNPLYQSGTIAVLMLAVLLATGVYLLLFYRIGAPYASVERIQEQVWAGRWIRSLHRYASDVAMVAIAVHAVRMFLRRRSWGPRALAWLSGLALLGLFFLIALTGFVMVWDQQGRLLAMEGARLLDVLPLFTEPISRAFSGERPMPGAFFFLNYFLHIAVPLGIALFLYLHLSRLARPNLLPGRRFAWSLVGILTLVAVVRPAPLPPEADPTMVPYGVPVDWFFAFWVPLVRAVPAGWAWVGAGLATAAALTAPLWTRPAAEGRPEASRVDERRCTGCTQCSLDCPYDAITMVARSDGREGLVASIDPDLCVSCGICAGSCAPMSVGPPGRTGRDQLERLRAFLAREEPSQDEVVLLTCLRGAGELSAFARFEEALVYPVDCIGSLHTSVVELLLKGGAGGVLVAACPERDCWNREGTKWARQRLFEDREAELQERVPRARVRFVQVGAGERGRMAREVHRFAEHVQSLRVPRADEDFEPELECDRPVATSGASGEGASPGGRSGIRNARNR